MEDTTNTENLKERCIERVRETVESERESLNRYGPALAVCALVVAAMLAGVPFAGQVEAQDFEEQIWQDDFSDGNTDGWVGDNIFIDENSQTGTQYTLRAEDNTESFGHFPEWQEGPNLDLSEEFRISGVSKVDLGAGTYRSGFGIIDDEGLGAMLIFSSEFDNTQVTDDARSDETGDATVADNFDNQWVEWEIYSDGEGNLYASVWPHGTEEPEDWMMQNTFDESSGQFTIWSGAVEDWRVVNLDTVEITGQEAPPPDDNELYLETQRLLLHGDRADYTVYFNGTEDGSRVDVTEDSTVISSNEEALTVDDLELQLVATEDETINASVQVTAEYTHDTVTYETYQDVTVAVVSVANMQILPGTYRYTVLLGDWSYVGILISTMFGVIGARMTSAFGGIAGVQLALTAMWVGGLVSLGIALVGLFASMFIGLNLAANINYMGGR